MMLIGVLTIFIYLQFLSGSASISSALSSGRPSALPTACLSTNASWYISYSALIRGGFL